MSSSSIDEVRLLAELVAVPSPSGSEEDVARLAEEAARRAGLDVRNDELGVVVEVVGRTPGPTLALVSHLDTVPPGEGWTRDPYDPAVEDGRLYGRGSGDAKASVVAMLAAAADVAARGLPRGRLLVVLGRCEETRDTTMPALVPTLGTIDAAVVGEPTNLDLAVAQRGLLRLDLVARGTQIHAGRAGGDGFVNAIATLARDLVALEGVGAGRPHPALGEVTITPTMVEGGVTRNVTPPVARACLDVRTTPAWTHAELIERIRECAASEVEVVSERLVPCETPRGSRLVATARAARPASREYGSPTCSDWVWFRELDAVKCGPGTSARSHTPDECVDLDEVREARAFYAALARTLVDR